MMCNRCRGIGYRAGEQCCPNCYGSGYVVAATTSPNRPPSCDLPPEFYQLKLKPCPLCGAEAERSSCNRSVFRCSDVNCLTYGPWKDPHGRKWNAIPRRSEVLELLRLVNSLKSTQSKSEEFPKALHAIYGCADKLRKEMESQQ